jgi:hypothetical protein
VAPNVRRAVCALAVGSLWGCEVVAGIHDLQLTPTYDGAMSGLDASGMASGTSQAPPDAMGEAGSSSTPDSGDTADGSATTGDATVDASAIDESPADALADASGIADAGTEAASDAKAVVTELIDDMEGRGVPTGWLDGVSVANPRAGTWFVFDDGTDGGMLTPAPAPAGSAAQIIATIPGGRGASAHAAHVVGNSGFTNYGAGMGFNLNVDAGSPHVYDATAYQGFTFWARAAGDASSTVVLFNVLDRNTAMPPSGGICDGGACNGSFGSTLVLTDAWQLFTVHYTDLRRPVWAISDGSPFDPSNMIGCQFQVEGQAFDLWVDDIYFIDK